MLRHSPLALLLAVTVLSTFLIQSGELGTSDTTHRLQVSHSLWTGQPQVFPNEFPEFGVHGRGGRLYASYGIGQSLVMLPADLMGTALSRLPLWRQYAASGVDPAVRSIVVSIGMNVVVNVLTALAAFRLLGLLGFTMREAAAGTLGLLVATTHLHYAQNMTENNLILLLTLAGFALQYRWLKTGEGWALFWGAMALGFNLLIRLTTMLDRGAVAGFLVLASYFGAARFRWGVFLRTVVPVYGGFLLLDRVYQYVRFGSWTDTYVSVMAREQLRLNPALPAKFPFDGHWFQGGIASGVLGPFFAPEKSVFLFDPLFPLTLVLLAMLWRWLAAPVRAFAIAALGLLATYTAFYGNYDSWGGDFAWGDRYLESTVELVALLALPLLLRHWRSLRAWMRWPAVAMVGISVVVQLASLAFWLPLELYQGEKFGRHMWIVALRLKNIAAFALDRREAWGLNTPAIYQDPWDAVHLTAWNFLPSLLRHIGVAPPFAVAILDGVWLAAAGALLVACWWLLCALRHEPGASLPATGRPSS